MPDPVVHPADVTLAAGMSALAGAACNYGVLHIPDLYVSVMSGNTADLGRHLADNGADLGRIETIIELVLLFVAGAVIGSAIAAWSGARRIPVILALVTALLALAAAYGPATIPATVLAMGAVNNTITQIGTANVGLTYVTGSLEKFGHGLGRLLIGRNKGWAWTVQGLLWLTFFVGAVVATLLQHRAGPNGWPLAAYAAVLTVLAIPRRVAPN